jgi:hypothetical protein
MQFINSGNFLVPVSIGGAQISVKPQQMISLDEAVGLAHGLLPLGDPSVKPPVAREQPVVPPSASVRPRAPKFIRQPSVPVPVAVPPPPPPSVIEAAPMMSVAPAPLIVPAPLEKEVEPSIVAMPAVPPSYAAGAETNTPEKVLDAPREAVEDVEKITEMLEPKVPVVEEKAPPVEEKIPVVEEKVPAEGKSFFDAGLHKPADKSEAAKPTKIAKKKAAKR